MTAVGTARGAIAAAGITAADLSGMARTLAELGRLLYTHRLAPTLVAGAVGLKVSDLARLVAGERLAPKTCEADASRAVLVLNVLVRVEVRCCHDTAAIQAALERALAELCGASIAERLPGCTDPADITVLRHAAGIMPLAKVPMWRVGDRYS